MALAQDDLPLMANTSHMLVRHYTLDLDVSFESQVFMGSAVLFLEPGGSTTKAPNDPSQACPSQQADICLEKSNLKTTSCNVTDFSKGELGTFDKTTREPISGSSSSIDSPLTGNPGREEFVLVLDCCDLSVLKVEEVDVAAVSGTENLRQPERWTDVSGQEKNLGNQIVHGLVTLPDHRWREQHDYYSQCSQAPSSGELLFTTGTWSLQVKKAGCCTPSDFPRAIRIVYKTKPEGRSVRWTVDQSYRPCVYTIGSNINNRALFPCQEPPVAMSTWQATIRAAAGFVVLMSGENVAEPEPCQEGLCRWFYYVTMPMPASTFTIAVGCWSEVGEGPRKCPRLAPLHPSDDVRLSKENCGHMDYPCRLSSRAAEAQAIIPHRLYAPLCLVNGCREVLLPLIPRCLSAAHHTLGTHPFSRLDLLIVPSNFSSLGMASPHIIFLSQSVLSGRGGLCGTRVCHEIAHAWFGLAIGARDWTEEWLSEGFATHLEDVFWVKVQELSQQEASAQRELKALLRWRRLRDEVQNSEEALQVLRPNREKTGEVTESGAYMVRHGLNPEKNFMQVHYLKGYFLLRHLASKIGEEAYFTFLKKFVQIFHGQLILSQDFLHMLLEHAPEHKGLGQSVEAIYQGWLDTAGIPKPLLEESHGWTENGLVQQVEQEVTKWIRHSSQGLRKGSTRKRRRKESCFVQLLPDQLVLLLETLLEEKTLCPRTLQRLQKLYSLREQDAEVRHRWCELVVKHKYTAAYGDLETFLREDQAMGVYLYGELMVNEDAKQQELARRCFAAVQDEMDASTLRVVQEMLF
ncbi:aminopeptidase O [Ambystoma mexicanum]|uniref:aminopeptidase O n=1 Tax=Ambystoma mexicanum TaxID=8296 RepID=UPI0037E715EA